ncbi:MAG: hypothetical protein Hyperionvirus38_5 [Hyperionvirus sp.]|uniref:Uncharacterized protein n=1 Tax=Hyperionvirus sp. TaxID=2487770 RepID=A0A3G5AC84_9VIRU|nr:MAG: hypothetical protein Hyperionvirus38_5 [Hyperionvirus sp.]
MTELKIPNEKLLEKMVLEEETIRTSKAYEDKCTAVKHIPNGWLEVTASIQKDIVIKNGFTDSMSCDVACNMLRTAHILYPKNEIFTKVPLYVRNNKANIGTLTVGDIAPEISLHDLDGKAIQLHTLLAKKTIIISATGT